MPPPQPPPNKMDVFNVNGYKIATNFVPLEISAERPIVALGNGDFILFDGDRWVLLLIGGVGSIDSIELISPVYTDTTVESIFKVDENGVFFPKLSDAPNGPVAGQVYYDTSTNKLRCYDGSNWHDLY